MNSSLSPSSSSSDNSSYYPNNQQSAGGFAYGIGISIGVLLLVVILTLASYLCTRMLLIVPHDPPIAPIHRYSFTSSASVRRRDQSSSLELGLDDDALGSFPKFSYSQAKDHITRQGGGGRELCSICLADYKGSDLLRLLQDCGHVFHVKCVDPWLRSHPTCPVCRSSPVPSPLANPLAEVTPFASRLS